MTMRSLGTLLALLLTLAGCREWRTEPAPAPEVWALRFDPPMEEGRADRIVRLSVAGAAGAMRPEEVWLVTGEVASTQLSALQRGEPSKALTERRVAARAFVEGSDLVIVPELPLAAGTVTVVSPEPRWTTSFDVREDDRWPRLERVWPPNGVGQPSAWVFCGDAVTGEPAEALLAPAAISGAFERWVDPRCIKFTGEPLDAGFVVPPPWIVCDGTPCSLDPGALVAAPPSPIPPLACEPAEVPFGAGCAIVEDDRLVVRAPASPLYWVVAIDGAEVLFSAAEAPDARFVVRGLTPDTEVPLLVRTLDAGGAERIDLVHVSTKAAAPHIVLSEVYANPIGAEPAQEWIELYNDGVEAVPLVGALLKDAGGEAVLPEIVLPAGAFVVLGTQALELDDGFDVPIPASCLLAKFESLGKNGLSNSGEPLTLVGPTGDVWSRFRPLAASKPGESAIRTAPDAFDDDPDAFATTPHVTPCAPNEASHGGED